MTEPSLPQESIFLQALEIPVAERAAFLDRACAGNNSIRAEVDELLRAHQQTGDLLDLPASLSPTVDQPNVERPGTVIGHYKLLQQIGEGGMGTVFMAEQTEPVQRKVAVKIVKAGSDSRQVIARFQAERQALALMDHPNIAQVHDAGTTPSGLPYFVMELVKGKPITNYCDEHHLTPRQRLELFVPVCQAIQHAHQKGIIHRDIKPSNVLVCQYDGKPAPKVIDFGVAKAAGPKLTEATLFTEFGQVVGTLEYMSPEQAELNQLDVDTRSDIYSLGVLLYELLTGTTPLSRKRLKGAAFLEVLRLIREEEPPKPSTRLSTTEELPSIAANRGLEPKKLSGMMRRELDWIVMKALDKDRNRRYETANGFMHDVQRYLADETVQACPPSMSYRLRKFVRRNRVPAIAGALVLLALLAGIVGTSLGLVRARQAEHIANDERDITKVERDKARAAELAATESEADTKAFSKFLVDDVLSTPRPEGWLGGLGIGVTVRRALDEAAKKVGEQFHGRPRAEAETRQALGSTYHLLGENNLAEPHVRRAVELRQQALGPDHLETLESQRSLGAVLSELGRNQEALTLLEKTLEQSQRVFGPDHVTTGHSYSHLGYVLYRMGRSAEAVQAYEKAVRVETAVLGPYDANTLSSQNMLATSLLAAGQVSEAMERFEKVWELKKAHLSPNNPSTLMSMRGLAGAYEKAGRAKEAFPLYAEAIKQSGIKLGPDHPYTLSFVSALAWAHQLAGQNAEAVRMGEDLVQRCTANLPAGDRLTLHATHDLAHAYSALDRPTDAIRLLEPMVKLMRANAGSGDRVAGDDLNYMHALASAYRSAGRLLEAIALHEEVLKQSRIKLGNKHTDTLAHMDGPALAYQDAERLADALPLYEESARIAKGDIWSERPKDAH